MTTACRVLFLSTLLGVIAACSGGDDDDGASAPEAPSMLAASLMANKPHLTWMDGAGTDEISIERMVTGTGAFAEIATETFGIEQYHDTSAAAGTAYSYRVMGMNGSGMSSPSNEIQITTP